MSSSNELLPAFEEAIQQQVVLFAKADLAQMAKQEVRVIVKLMTDFISSSPTIQSVFSEVSIPTAAQLASLNGDSLALLANSLQLVFRKLNSNEEVVTILATPNTNLVSELNNIDFEKLIGGPIQGVIRAQAASALTTIDFIKEVGFELDENGNPTKVRYVDFVYDEKTVDEDGNESSEQRNIKVPILSMVTVPSLRFEEVNVDFNVKLNSVQSSNSSSKFGINGSVQAGWGPVKLKVSSSYQRKSSTGTEVKKQYSMNVKVRATQDEMPLGLEKILNLMAN